VVAPLDAELSFYAKVSCHAKLGPAFHVRPLQVDLTLQITTHWEPLVRLVFTSVAWKPMKCGHVAGSVHRTRIVIMAVEPAGKLVCTTLFYKPSLQKSR
jgi:hypothetical protein